jgi:hypothetical protein
MIIARDAISMHTDPPRKLVQTNHHNHSFAIKVLLKGATSAIKESLRG